MIDQQRVFVRGMGIISALGISAEQNLSKLMASESGIGTIRYLDTEHSERLPSGEVKHSNQDLLDILEIQDFPGMSRAALLGMIAATEACKNADLKHDPRLRIGLISGTTGEAMTSVESYFRDFQNNDSKNEYIATQDWGHSTELIAKHLSIDGFMTTINTACSSAANAISTGMRMIRNGLLDRAVVGGTDALSKVLLNGFNTLMIVDSEPTKPFDKNRNGMNLGEGAAYLVLESEAITEQSNCLAECSGYGIMSEAYHLTAQSQSGDGAYQSMKEALDRSGLQPGDIDYINAHGTATINNDLSEGKAISRLFKDHLPMVSSTKAFTGHTQGATGALEAVISILSLQEQMAFANLNTNNPMDEIDFTAICNPTKDSINHVLSNALGFGGNNTSLIFSNC